MDFREKLVPGTACPHCASDKLTLSGTTLDYVRPGFTAVSRFGR